MPKFNAVALPLAAFSIGLGLAELFAPDRVGRAAGIDGRRGLIRAYGARELMAGGLILAAPMSPTPLWMRVGGDLLDLLTLAPYTKQANNPGYRKSLGAAALVAAVTLIDVAATRARKQAG
jgi:hypothetical protein